MAKIEKRPKEMRRLKKDGNSKNLLRHQSTKI